MGPPFSAVHSPKTPRPISTKFERDYYIGHANPLCQIWFLYIQRGGRVAIRVNLPPWCQCFYFILLFYFLTFLLTWPDRTALRRNVVIGSKDVFPRILVPIRGLVFNKINNFDYFSHILSLPAMVNNTRNIQIVITSFLYKISRHFCVCGSVFGVSQHRANRSGLFWSHFAVHAPRRLFPYFRSKFSHRRWLTATPISHKLGQR